MQGSERIIEQAQANVERESEARIAAIRTEQASVGRADCEDCGAAIPSARRAALPSARRCIVCQTKAERR